MSLTNPALEPKKILLVESDTEQSKIIVQFGAANNWNIFNFPDSMAAIKWIKNNGAPSLMIIDKNASPLNAFQTQNYIQSELKLNTPVIVSCTSNIENENYDNKLLCFVNKPFSKQTEAIIQLKLKDINSAKISKDKDYSLSYLRDLADGDEEFVITSLNLFKVSVADKLSEMKEALSINEFKKVREIAHNIKPSFETLDSNKGRDLCHDLVHRVDEKEVCTVVNKLNELYTSIDKQLKNDIPEYAKT